MFVVLSCFIILYNGRAQDFKDWGLSPMTERLLINGGTEHLLKELTSSLETCERFYFGVAFLTYSGAQLLLDTLKEAGERGKSGRILSSTYLNFTDPEAVARLSAFPFIDTKMFNSEENGGFHTKTYIFEYKEHYKIIIGSSNLTRAALKTNVEWNVEIISKKDESFVQQVLTEYQTLWNRSQIPTEDFLDHYRSIYRSTRQVKERQQSLHTLPAYIAPNSMQSRAMKSLERLRSLGENKALVIAATGTGKTYMAAFDVQKLQPKRLLFLVHREDILVKAKETFSHLLHQQHSFGMMTGSRKDIGADYLFANIRTMANHYSQFDPAHFDYIVYDEAHHTTAPQYQQVMKHFHPAFALGMTATPERSDEASVFEVFDHNVAAEVRLHDALKDEIIAPFHYFGITDVDGIRLDDVAPNDQAELSRRLQVHFRVEHILTNMYFYKHDGAVRRGLGFCVNIDHAVYMADAFSQAGVPSVALTGDDPALERKKMIEKLEDEHDPLEFIFTVDIFNEGVDIPSVNLVLMLRPTESPIVFIQQLGRGLRKHPGKEFLTVLDFIGNHNRAFLVAIALNGSRYYDKESLKVAVATDFATVPAPVHIQMDRIAKERIIAQIDQESFFSMKYLKEAYLQFKQIRNGKAPSALMDYFTYDGAPDPIPFIEKSGSYLHFLAKVEKNDLFQIPFEEKSSELVYKSLSSHLPLKRPHEFALLDALMTKDKLTREDAEAAILHWLDTVPPSSVAHAMNTVAQQYMDKREQQRSPALAEWQHDCLVRTEHFTHLLESRDNYERLHDVIEYGLHRYERDFGSADHGLPFLKVGAQYQMKDAALLSNFSKTHSSFRGSGLLANEKDYFLYVDLHKDADVAERLNYHDEFLDRSTFLWDSPNNMTPDSLRGRNIMEHEARGYRLHLFVRKYKSIEGNRTEPFIYVGELTVVEASGSRPIQFRMHLKQPLPSILYKELTEKV